MQLICSLAEPLFRCEKSGQDRKELDFRMTVVLLSFLAIYLGLVLRANFEPFNSAHLKQFLSANYASA